MQLGNTCIYSFSHFIDLFGICVRCVTEFSVTCWSTGCHLIIMCIECQYRCCRLRTGLLTTSFFLSNNPPVIRNIYIRILIQCTWKLLYFSSFSSTLIISMKVSTMKCQEEKMSRLQVRNSKLLILKLK